MEVQHARPSSSRRRSPRTTDATTRRVWASTSDPASSGIRQEQRPERERSREREDAEKAHHPRSVGVRRCLQARAGGTDTGGPVVRPPVVRPRPRADGRIASRPPVRIRRGALLYSAGPHQQRPMPRDQEVSDRAFRAHRPSREATERPDDGDPPNDRRRDAGEVYPVPRPLGRGLFDVGGAADRRCGRWRPPPLAHAPWGALAHVLGRRLRLDDPRRRFSVLGSATDAGHRDRRAAVGRRGQGQDDRLPGRAGRDGRPLPGWRQRRPHGRQRRRGLQAPPHAVGRALSAHHLGHRERRRRQPGHADRRARHAHVARDRCRPGPGQPQRARDHAVPRGPRPGQRGAPGRRQGGHDGPRDRADVRRPGVAARPADGGPARPRHPARADRRALPDKNLLLANLGDRTVRGRAAGRPRRRAGASVSATTSTTRPGSSRRPWRAASTSCSRAPRARSWTSTTAAIRSSRPRTRSPAARARAAGSARSRSTRSSGS